MCASLPVELLFLTTEHLYRHPTWLFCSVLIPSPVPSPVVIEDKMVSGESVLFDSHSQALPWQGYGVF